MPESAEQRFFKTFTEYVKLRLIETETSNNELSTPVRNLVEHFKDFLDHHRGDPDSMGYQNLVDGMTAMKDARGRKDKRPKEGSE